MTKRTPFTEEFEKSLKFGKHSKWVLLSEFTDENLLCLFCMFGEIHDFAPEIVPLLWRERDSKELLGCDRAILALEAIYCFVEGDRFDVDEWARRTHDGRIRRVVEDLPAPVRLSITETAPEVAWTRVMRIEEGYELMCNDAAGNDLYAYFSPDGGVIHVGKERRLGGAKSASAFSTTLTEAIDRQSRARWATRRPCSEENLRCLLWLAGRLQDTTGGVLQYLEAHRPEVACADRAMVVLQALENMGMPRERFDLEELERRIRRKRGNLEFGDLPDAARNAVDLAWPEMQWISVSMRPQEFILVGKEAAGNPFAISVDSEGTIVRHHGP